MYFFDEVFILLGMVWAMTLKVAHKGLICWHPLSSCKFWKTRLIWLYTFLFLWQWGSGSFTFYNCANCIFVETRRISFCSNRKGGLLKPTPSKIRKKIITNRNAEFHVLYINFMIYWLKNGLIQPVSFRDYSSFYLVFPKAI